MASRRSIAALLALLVALCGAAPAFAGQAKKGKKKKAYDYDKSPYKAYGVLTDPPAHTYRFDRNGNPIAPAGARKKAKKKKLSSSAAEAPPTEDASGSACGAGDACAAK